MILNKYMHDYLLHKDKLIFSHQEEKLLKENEIPSKEPVFIKNPSKKERK